MSLQRQRLSDHHTRDGRQGCQHPQPSVVSPGFIIVALSAIRLFHVHQVSGSRRQIRETRINHHSSIFIFNVILQSWAKFSTSAVTIRSAPSFQHRQLIVNYHQNKHVDKFAQIHWQIHKTWMIHRGNRLCNPPISSNPFPSPPSPFNFNFKHCNPNYYTFFSVTSPRAPDKTTTFLIETQAFTQLLQVQLLLQLKLQLQVYNY